MQRSLVIALSLLSTGCMVGPRYSRPAVITPPGFVNAAEASAVLPLETLWWKTFHDAELDSLIARGIGANLDLEQASARVAQARASAGVARSQLAPDSNLTGGATRDRQRFFTGIRPNGSPELRAVNFKDFVANFDASWEIDLWGRIRSRYHAALYDLAAQEQDRRDVLILLLSEIGRNYAELRGAQLRLDIAARNQRDESNIVSLTEIRAAAGLATERDVSQAKAALASLEATIPPLQSSFLVSLHRLGVLLGLQPEALRSELSVVAALPEAVNPVGTGVPSALLERRPDIRRAEAQLQAATARIGVAKADYFPRITIKASGGRDANQFQDLSLGASSIFGIGPSFSVPLFNAGRIRSNVRLERARAQEAGTKFRASVLNALEESENALARLAQEQSRAAKLQIEVDQEKTVLLLSQVQYKAGLVDFTTVLTAERDLQTAEDQIAQSRVAQTTNLIAVYKALGGGWEISASAPATKP